MGFSLGTAKDYVLPLVEFWSVFNATIQGSSTSSSSSSSSNVALRPFATPSSVPFYRIERGHNDGDDITEPDAVLEALLVQTVQRCILAYGLFHVLAFGDSVGAAATHAASLGDGERLKESATATAVDDAGGSRSAPSTRNWRAGVVEVKEQRQDQSPDNALPLREREGILRQFHPFFHNVAGLDPALQQRDERDPCPDLDFFIFLLPPSGHVLLCRRLAKGPATGKGYTYATTPRRPRGGVLKLLAERRQGAAFTTPTAMEPEVGWLMGNLAGVRAGSKVLDPFVGSGSLLFAASLLEAGELVGTDASEELVGEGPGTARQEILKSFVYTEDVFGPWVHPLEVVSPMPSPVLAQADILTHQNHPLFRWEYYDVIVTDPPYDIKAKVHGATTKGAAAAAEGGEERDVARERQAAAMPAIVKLVEAAAEVLAPGGRLVFFLPVWGKHPFREDTIADAVAPPSALPPLPPALRLVVILPQVFSPTFVRWLVCVEKRRA